MTARQELNTADLHLYRLASERISHIPEFKEEARKAPSGMDVYTQPKSRFHVAKARPFRAPVPVKLLPSARVGAVATGTPEKGRREQKGRNAEVAAPMTQRQSSNRKGPEFGRFRRKRPESLL